MHAEANLISPDYLIERPSEDKRGRKNQDSNKLRTKKKDKENKKESPEVENDQKTSTNAINGSSREDAEEQKKRKRKRKRRYQKDVEAPSHANKKTNTNEPEALTPSSVEGLSSAARSENFVNPVISQKENTAADTLIKKDKTVKPRTRASAKKTIEKLKANNKNPIESNDTSKDTKMGKKGWWDR